MSPLVADAVGSANLVACTLSAEDDCARPWTLLHGAGWLSTAAEMAVK